MTLPKFTTFFWEFLGKITLFLGGNDLVTFKLIFSLLQLNHLKTLFIHVPFIYYIILE